MPARIDHIVFCLTACLAPCVAGAQAPSWPSSRDIDRALKAMPFPSGEQMRAQPVPSLPHITPHAAAIDIEAMVREGARHVIPRPDSSSAPTPLRIFITLDMPRVSLQLLVDQASRGGAVLVLRGLKSHSMRATLADVSELIREHQVGWVIDPEAFTRFSVEKAPTFVLTLDHHARTPEPLGCATGCVTPASFVSVAGDVSLDFALQTMLRHRPDIAARAKPLLERLRAAR